jgi:hypothetical protein
MDLLGNDSVQYFRLAWMIVIFTLATFCVLALAAPYYWIIRRGGVAALCKFFWLSKPRLGYNEALYTVGVLGLYYLEAFLLISTPLNSIIWYFSTLVMAFIWCLLAAAVRARINIRELFKSTAIEATFVPHL